jgi:hypothetical protein
MFTVSPVSQPSFSAKRMQSHPPRQTNESRRTRKHLPSGRNAYPAMSVGDADHFADKFLQFLWMVSVTLWEKQVTIHAAVEQLNYLAVLAPSGART